MCAEHCVFQRRAVFIVVCNTCEAFTCGGVPQAKPKKSVSETKKSASTRPIVVSNGEAPKSLRHGYPRV